MRKFFLALIMICMINLPVYCEIVQGGVAKDTLLKKNRVIDATTNRPIKGAKITLPQDNYSTYTDSNGAFTLDADISGQTVLSIAKAGYKPFSVTIGKADTGHPIILGIEKATPHDITLETSMFHLGDNSFSDLSANARQFQVRSIGPFYSKSFNVPSLTPGAHVSLIIGSIIGVDTLLAKKMGQNKVNNAYASPPEVYFNGNKIADIQINGDKQKIRVPYGLIRQNEMNEVTIKTGKNMMQTAYVDYDDIEFMNLSLETN